MKQLLIPLSAAAMLLAGCKKDNLDPDGLVKATQDGKNTGDFLLDGHAFNPRPRVSTPANKPVSATWDRYKRHDVVNVTLFREDDDGRVRLLALAVPGVRRPGAYPVADAMNPYVVPGPQAYIVYERLSTNPAAIRQYFVTGPKSPGLVVITRFDTVAHVVSGTFEAKLRDFDGPDSVQVAKGRFDCTFRP